MGNHDIALGLSRGIAHQPSGGVVKGRAKNEQVSACNRGIIGKRQDVHPFGGDTNSHGVGFGTVNRAKDDFRAIVHGLDGL